MSYHQGIDRISSSGVKMLINKTPAHFYRRYGLGAPEEVSRPLVFGSAFHAMVLEGEAVCKGLYGDAPAHPGTAKYAAWLEQSSHLAGGLKPDDWREIKFMQQALADDVEIAKLLAMPAKIEERIDFTDDETGMACKIKPDFLANDGSVMLDLKTTADATERGIYQSVRRFDYDLSAAMYLRGVEAALGVTPRWGWVFVEKVTHLPRLVWASDETIETGNAKLDKGLAIYRDCAEVKSWPGYETIEF